MDSPLDIKSTQDQILHGLVTTTKIVGHISAEDITFQKSLNRDVGDAIDVQSQRLLSLASALIRSAASISELRVPTLEDPEDIENNWRGVIDVVDSLLEKSDTCLDEYTGVIKRKDSSDTILQSEQGTSLGHNFRVQNLVKPQLSFEIKPNNHDESPWKPLLTKKPHAVVSLDDSLEMFIDNNRQKQYRHPYEQEILQMKYPEFVYRKEKPIPYPPIDTTQAIFVDTEQGVMEMLKELKLAKEIAVDIEHHDARSYVGLLSLMQISTRDKDWVIDTLKSWRHNLQVLNEVFADPKILKVFHGAFMDIVWLQRDLGLYIVGLFDTYRASQTLGYPAGSLAFLLKKIVDFDADKVYQMADWRIRPLPEKMLFYARADTHFLLYIYDIMRNELIEKSTGDTQNGNFIDIVLEKSKETSLSRYERQIYNEENGKGPGGWYSMLVKTPALLNNEQFAVFRAVHAWRDKIARAEDDSPTYLMPQNIVLNLAKLMPTDILALTRVARPVAHSVKSRAPELLEVIKSAKLSGKSGPSMMDALRSKLDTGSDTINPSSVNKADDTKSLIPKVDEGELRSQSSSFWGSAFGSSVWDTPYTAHKSNPEISLSLPVTPSEPIDRILSDQVQATVKRVDDPHVTKQETNDDEFILKKSAKRKSNVDQNSYRRLKKNCGEADVINEDACFENKEEVQNLSKVQLLTKNIDSMEEGSIDPIPNPCETQENDLSTVSHSNKQEPFDYSKAESILHGKQREVRKPTSKTTGHFDPYAKVLNAPAGKRRIKNDRPARASPRRSYVAAQKPTKPTST
ncbi:Exosome complex exonuclease [Blumeria hordei DH14]|uniref:Exosome complex exonuclease n=1 Tax=Blumeria graminis f. sp. hordei (strain DH14) TaxID=546991 RepID=N1J7A2_BLUG1|nr:Exosome complex exonuclease [Blumeria hordei DH14]